MLKIGEFARKNSVTVRALYHYEEIGLLEPAETDKFSGYRYYNESQSRDIRIINILKDLGFSLTEISGLIHIEIEKENLILRLNEKYTQARIDLDRAQSRSLGIEKLMSMVQKMPDNRGVNLKGISDVNMRKLDKGIATKNQLKDAFERIINNARDTGENITTLVMDIDGFKLFNDKYGNKIGDAVLDAIFRGIVEKSPGGSGLLWGGKSILERSGGDECIMRMHIDAEEGKAIAESICSHICEMSFEYLGVKDKLTLSIGLADLSSNPKNAEEFTHLAESALYLAKHNGRNRVEVYTEDIKEKLNNKR